MSVVLTRHGAVLKARIDRPRASNACDSTVLAGLTEWLDQADAPDVRALVLTGTGRAFCAGADLVEASALLGDPAGLRAFLAQGRDLVRRLRTAPVPTVAAVNGVAFGGGLELLLASDIAIAGRAARVGDRHIAVGQLPGWGSSAMLPRAVGPVLARRLLLTGETWTGEQAAGHGLVSEVVDDDRLAGRALEVAQGLAALAPVALRRMLDLARGPADADDDAWAREWEALTVHASAQGSAPAGTLLGALRRAGSAPSSPSTGSE